MHPWPGDFWRTLYWLSYWVAAMLVKLNYASMLLVDSNIGDLSERSKVDKIGRLNSRTASLQLTFLDSNVALESLFSTSTKSRFNFFLLLKLVSLFSTEINFLRRKKKREKKIGFTKNWTFSQKLFHRLIFGEFFLSVPFWFSFDGSFQIW